MVESNDVHPHAAKLKNDDGSWKYTNALADQTSPYLLQHAHNPVDWHPWGTEAFELARKLGKPIFLSVGYSTCYWCHVMERQVFEDPAIAAVLNEHFVSIKVDREERPDVDDVYMMAVQLITRRGGWPMSVFLTPPGAKGAADPGLRPFWAGTYIPPEPRYGMPGFTQVVLGLSESWRDDRQKVLDGADRVVAAVQANLGQRDAGGELDISVPVGAAAQIFSQYDGTHGGFGAAPKFPTPTNLLLLLRVYRHEPKPELWQALAHTLERMARGGMYDQVGGGFHRYSTDEKWLVPHFEKMLYDNALLIETYLTAQAIQPHANDPDLYTRIVRQTCDYVLREMTEPPEATPAPAPAPGSEDTSGGTSGGGGAFWSAQDAEVDAREGDNYLWQGDQITKALDDAKLAKLALRLYGLDRGTNFKDPHDATAKPANVLFVPEPFDKLAADLDMSLAALLEAKAAIDASLLAVRDQRKQPGTDDKVLAGWNGLMIAALARAGRDLDEPRYSQAAASAADTILRHMRSADGGLCRTMRRGEAKIPAFLEDYAFMIHGLIELHRTDHDRRWLEAVDGFLKLSNERFGDGRGGYYDMLADQSDLFVRLRSTWDGAIPTGASQMGHNLMDLYEITTDAAYLDQAGALLRSFAGSLRQGGPALAHLQHALLRLIEADPAKVAAPASQPAQPQQAEVVSIRVEPDKVDLSALPVRVRVVLSIAADHHLNAPEATEAPATPDTTAGEAGAVIPTTLTLTESPGLKLRVDYPAGEQKRFPFADAPLKVYEGQVELIATISADGTAPATAPAPGSRPRLILRFQACTDTACLLPREVELPVTFE